MGGIEILIPIVGEALKIAIMEANLRKMAAAAGVSDAALDAALVNARAAVAALPDPHGLPVA